MKWRSTEDMDTVIRLCNFFNQGKAYEVFGNIATSLLTFSAREMLVAGSITRMVCSAVLH